MTWTARAALGLLLALGPALPTLGQAPAQLPSAPQAPSPTRAPAPATAPAAADPEQAASQAVIRKLNAYVALLNRTLRASESLARYASWVDMRTGPTGRERINYGLYSLYDVRSEIAAARAAAAAPPAMPGLDEAVGTYVAAYEALAPVIAKADGYYDRQDYRADKMAEGKALHLALAPAGAAFRAERAKVDALFAEQKGRADATELALIEKREGRKALWHVTHVMIRARAVVDLLPKDSKPVVDLAAFDAALAPFAAAVKEMDDYGAANPDAGSSFDGRPRSFLGKLREFREKMARAKGDARRGAANDLTWIVNDYNAMVTFSRGAARTGR